MSSERSGNASHGPILDRLFGEFVEAVSEGRDVDLDAVLPERPELRGELQDLYELALQVAVRRPESLPPIPGFEMISELGRGGMGTVYLCRQERLDRMVALKTLSSRLVVGDRSRARFEREIRAVAGLDHPAIVSVYETGEAEGVPFYTMEYVKGRSMSEVIRLLRATERPPSELLGRHLAEAVHGDHAAKLPKRWQGSWFEAACRATMDVAYALEHAHVKNVIHRDVKPSNILVRRDGKALLFDFGLALTDLDEDLTQSGDFLGSPFYVSPEQADAKRGELDHRSDIYSLGVTLYELITYQVPFQGATTHDVLQQILTREPRPPHQYCPTIPRDLEVICLVAMDKDPNRRYSTASDMAEDLRRFLAREPIRARPITRATRAIRFVQRNQALSLALALGLLILIGIPTGLYFYERALHEQEKKATEDLQLQINKLTAAMQFQQDLFGSVHPDERGRKTSVATLLDQAIPNVQNQIKRSPEVGLVSANFVVDAYMHLSLYRDARMLAELAARTAEAHPAIDVEVRFRALSNFGDILLEMGDSGHGLEIWKRALAINEEVYGKEHPRYADRLNGWARALRENDRLREAEEVMLELAERRKLDYGEISGEYVSGLTGLGSFYKDLGRWQEAVDSYESALAITLRLHDADHPKAEWIRHLIDQARAGLGSGREALHFFESQEAATAEKYGPTHLATLRHRNELALLLARNGEYQRSVDILRKVHASAVESIGPDNKRTLNFLGTLGSCLASNGEMEAARDALGQAVEGMRKVSRDPDSRDLLMLRSSLAMVQIELGEFDSAEEDMRLILAKHLELHGPDHEVTARSHANLGVILMKSGEHGESKTELQEAIRAADAANDPFDALKYRVLLGYSLHNLEQLEDAEALFLDCLAKANQHKLPNGHPDRNRIYLGLSEVYADQNRPEDAARYTALFEAGNPTAESRP